MFYIYLVFLFFQIEIIRNERDLLKAMRKLSATSNNVDFLRGLNTLMNLKPSPKTRNFNNLLSSTKRLVNPIESQTQKLIAKGQEMLKRRSTGTIADVFEDNSPTHAAFRKEVDALMKKLSQATSKVRKIVQKRRANASEAETEILTDSFEEPDEPEP